MYKTAIIFGLVLAFAQANQQNSGNPEGTYSDVDVDVDIDVDLEFVVKKLTTLVYAVGNIKLQGTIELGIDIDIGIKLGDLADFIESIIEHYHAGNKDPLKCLVRAFMKYNLYEAADAYVDYLLSFINLVNSVADSVAACNPGGISNPITVAVCLVTAAANYSSRIATLKIALIAHWAELALAIPSALLCAA